MPSPDCPHENFKAQVNVHRFCQPHDGLIHGYAADIGICCADCGRPFRFLGIRHGVSTIRPGVSFDATELRAPMEPVPDLVAADDMANDA